MTTAVAPFLKTRLSFMMLLQYAIWGAWLPILYPFLLGYRGFSLEETGYCLSAGAVGAIFGPFVIGQLADRNFSTEKLLFVSHLVGALLVWLLAEVDSFPIFVLISLVYGFVYAPTIALTNSITLANIRNRDRDFGPIRLWGTIGWIVAGILVGQYLLRTATPDLTDQGTMGVTATQLAADPDTSLPILLEKNPVVQQSFAAKAANWTVENGEVSTGSTEEVVAYMAATIRKSLADYAAAVKKGVEEGEPQPTPVELQAGEAEAAEVFIQGGLQNRGRQFAFSVSAALGLLMAIFCLFLPHTPPTKGAKDKFAWAEALGEIRLQPLLTLFLIAIPVSMIHQFYFVYTADFVSGIQNAANSDGANAFANGVNQILGVGGGGLMTLGQMSELLVLGFMPFLTKIFNRKMLLCIGLIAYALRMALFAFMPDMVPVLIGVALHGVCFGCFIFVAFMVVDEHTTKDVRATAQNLFNLVIIGIGIIVGSYFATGVIGNWATVDGSMDYFRLFTFPMWMAVGCLVIMLVAYPNRAKPLDA
ncbi:MAG: MFS transporter [Phycisphaerales bacterium]|nr:MFS transporter [Phycisphaerales bacterium]